MDQKPHIAAPGSRISHGAGLLVCLGLIAIIWCSLHQRWTPETFRIPISYVGDAWSTLAGLKAYATGEIAPLLPKWPKSFGAPFIANWNDYPRSEEGVVVWLAMFVRVFGLGAGANLGLLAGHLLAGASLFAVCRYLRYDLFFSICVAVLFGLSRFAFARSFPHITVAYYWHVPLALLVIYWCLKPEPLLANTKRFWASLLIAVLHGSHNPYYAGMFGQFLLCTSFVLLLGRADWRRIAAPLLVAAAVVATFALMNAETLFYSLEHGRNRVAGARFYSDVELYALKPVELVLPLWHRIPQLSAWATEAYFNSAFVLGEIGPPYLGVVAISGLVMLLCATAKALARGNSEAVPRHFWCVAWVLAFSVIGGLNALLALSGLALFRSSNRYSIVIMAVLLLFFVRQLSRWTRGWRWPARGAGAAAVLSIGLYDQLPPAQPLADIAAVRSAVENDQRFVRELEAALPPNAMVFNLPIIDFPEAGSLQDLSDYELLRPYLFSRDLRFSYGSDKGRLRERWQREAEQLGMPHFLQRLEQYGFATVLIARKGYVDRGAALQKSFAAAGRERVLAESPDMVAIALQPNPRPHLPPEFSRSVAPMEGDGTLNRRWSGGNARIILHNAEPQPRAVRVRFGLETNEPRGLEITFDRERLHTTRLDPAQPPPLVDLALTLQPGRNELRFKTDVRGKRTVTGSNARLRAFALVNFELTE